ncbi:MAG: GyrI-like domain-containing protein [Deltaproteobacteria bacterium]|nr:GyrI-like domain-containing protein [Deltaproteobacteria bacterium]MBW2175953.1 GyrI-like domain-containing protein [Deltaproteobacteria bacterium]MBW2296140.1 GyrI-like domain-containing protein [Deltaproteobacteria bacterium]
MIPAPTGFAYYVRSLCMASINCKYLHNEFIPKNNYALSGKHHEIYLSDPRKVKPEKLKTILRQPIRKT